MAAHNAVRDSTNFGKDCYVKGCRFHFSQNLTKHIRAVPSLRTNFDRKKPEDSGDSSATQESPERKWLLMFSGLSCLDPRMVQEGVQRLESVMPAGEDYKTFLDYGKKTYTSPDAKFPPDVWASVPSMEPATTNGAESFHTDFNAQFNAAHPNIFASISVLLEIQAQTYVKINSLRVGEKI
ncbi:Conserved oligomeric Golgi complex subunit 4 [Frankliniella fusca]|uniref:Conserved oligomeric Golgi complex subunit 4 n=1 Tax=Frankliniella fusca TaxID=407009 RepID=A0AAE1LUK3_9NEOP|nr:Conserved oligomeric Golgi complex subunit 4 [Frankliniella fusca]